MHITAKLYKELDQWVKVLQNSKKKETFAMIPTAKMSK